VLQRLRTGAVQSVPRSIEGEMRQLMEICQRLRTHARFQNAVEHASSEKRYDLPHAVVTI